MIELQWCSTKIFRRHVATIVNHENQGDWIDKFCLNNPKTISGLKIMLLLALARIIKGDYQFKHLRRKCDFPCGPLSTATDHR